MCDPISLTIAATAVAAVGQGVGALSANSQANYEAKVAKQNARTEEASARDAIERGKTDSQRYQRQLSQQMGAQNAALAANGIDISYGSAADVRGDTAMFGREDVQTITENSFREAKGFEINATNYLAQAKSAKQRGKAALVKGVFDMGSTVLGGATQVSKMRAGGG